MLDLAGRPALGGQPEADVRAAVGVLAARVDWDLARRLAHEQHRPSRLKAAADLACLANA